ncbi:hypothetical protein FRACA_10035 [Frankia canadensis]|uniref:Uncharacterized protein n=1 Tax=Frankia canadensis TaxID=1836972 RepID=A0A2I2KHY4_9ACTN|nr:hypothetical protein FRACA_10035 [Frankia canadensis]SOU52566.1 hypothetical protein FRACA_10035 [Frankia canadensis]
MILAAAASAPSTASGKPNAADWSVLMTMILMGDLESPELSDEPPDEHAATAVTAATAVAVKIGKRRHRGVRTGPLSLALRVIFLATRPSRSMSGAGL